MWSPHLHHSWSQILLFLYLLLCNNASYDCLIIKIYSLNDVARLRVNGTLARHQSMTSRANVTAAHPLDAIVPKCSLVIKLFSDWSESKEYPWRKRESIPWCTLSCKYNLTSSFRSLQLSWLNHRGEWVNKRCRLHWHLLQSVRCSLVCGLIIGPYFPLALCIAHVLILSVRH